MKKVLMTWYGITDLRAALGLEYSNGPILSALLAEAYKEVLVLGYTNKDKVNIDESNFETDLTVAKEAFKENDQSEVWSFINKYANTEIAHRYFVEWLKKSLQENNIKIEIIFRSVELDKLNDTEGIYGVAIQALDIVASFKSKREVTFYLSPGTPVMAFVWAFTALRHPELKKRLLASSVANKDPEVVILPDEWLEWHGKEINDDGLSRSNYDVIFHLFGEQRIPSLLGICQFESKKHVFINSKIYPAEVMKQFLGGAEFDEFSIDPYDPAKIKETILNYLENFPSTLKIGFNLTGGTKLMYAGALAASKKINATPFYFDGRNDKVIFLEDFKSEKTKKINSVETFLKLHGNDLQISKQGYWKDIEDIDNPERKQLTLKLWKYNSKISKLYWEIANEYADKDKPFELTTKDIHLIYRDDKSVEITFGEEKFSFNKWPMFGTYISGGWFEEYMYMLLEPYVKSGKIHDLRIGLEISFKETIDKKQSLGLGDLRSIVGETYQELDIVFTDGRKLYIVECKAGAVKSDHVMKLQNIVRYFGGSGGEGVLAACFAPKSKVTKKKIEDSSNIDLASGRYLKENIENLFY
ncbi:MAG TPA: DUF1887 family protein [Arcobacter sp.]|nr:DUF1887 family protein [Arcobacter sp.]